MVSRRNFFSIIVMMAVLLFMFQFSQVIKENDSDFDINTYALEESVPNDPKWRPDVMENGNFVVFCGSEDGAVYPVVEQWCVYTKRGLVVYDAPEEYQMDKDKLPEAVLVDSGEIDLEEQFTAFSALTDRGITLVFCNLPEAAKIKQNDRLRRLLGIGQVPSERIEVEGIHLFSGFLLGGEIWYMTAKEEEAKNQDLNLSVPWYITLGGTKTYMVGILEELLGEEEAKNEYFPPLIWRNSYGQSKVFVVNGDYLSDMTGLGILDAMMYEADSYVLYPVVNAQNAIVTNYPEFAGENDSVMMELYSRNMAAVQRDICWPDLAALIERNKLKLTCLLAPQYHYLDELEPVGETVPFYLQQLKETGGEAGISLDFGEGITLAEKLARDESFYASLENRYLYTSAFIEQKAFEQMGGVLQETELLENIRTVASDFSREEPVLSWYVFTDDNENMTGRGQVTLQGVTSEVKTHTYSDDLYVRSLETALGYSNIRIDMHDVLWPGSKEDQWENMYDSMASNLNTYWKAFSGFDRTTLTESDRRVRAFLNLDYSDRRVEDCIYLDVSGAEEGWFLLRVHGEEIESAEGVEYEEIEDGSYLLHATGAQAEIHLRRNGGLKIFYQESKSK